jgi:type IX secretion system PorP/SprF family membrane protein
MLAFKGLSQDVQFSQFYSSPLYLNPAFAGSAHHYRFITQNRWQWPGQDAKYNTYSFTADTYFNKYRSGVGLMVTHDRQGSNSISSTDIQLLYSYELHLNEKLTVRAGIQAGFITRYIDANKQFTDQFSNQGYDANTPSGEELLSPRKNMLDLSSGLILYSRRIWAGLSANHLNTPNQSFYSSVDPSPLPMKFSIVGGYKIPLVHNKHMAYLENEKDISITPTFLYKFQGKSDQVDVGIYGQYDQLLVGIWYRGIPFKRYEDFQNNESIIPQIGWHFQNFSVAYSYDFVVSKLTGARPYGAHEINLTYIVIKRHKGAKPMKRLPCPHFYKN